MNPPLCGGTGPERFRRNGRLFMTRHAQFSTCASKRACLAAIAVVLLATGFIGARDGFAQSPPLVASATADFYVAPYGDDTWRGSSTQPFRTVDRARLAVQTLKTQVSGRTITVFIRSGTYFMPSTWAFTSVDSGTASTPIVYANYPGEAPVISAGQVLTGWVQNSNGRWQTTLPLGTYFTQLWVNGYRRYPARTTPNGYLYITGAYSTTGSTTTADQLSYDVPPAGGVPATMANLGDVD